MTATSKSSLNQTLHFITEVKLQEVETQRRQYQERAKSLQDAVRDKSDVLEKVEILAKAIKNFRGSAALDYSEQVGGKLRLGDLTFWLQQAKYDPGFRIEIAEDWLRTLEDYIQHTSLRFDAAKLFGNLFNEWMDSGDSSAVAYQAVTSATAEDGNASDGDTNTRTGSEYIEVGRKEMYEQKEKLESLIFEDYPVDTEKLETYLETLFLSEEAMLSLEQLRNNLKSFGNSFRRRSVSTNDAKNAIIGLLASSLMDVEKRATLKTILENKTILAEVVSVMTMRMAKFSAWSWPKEGLMIEFRRHLNGKYKAFTDPEIVDALLLQHIGISWQVKLKTALHVIFRSDTWNCTSASAVELTPAARQLRKDQLVGDDGNLSIDAVRKETRREKFFVSQLQDFKSKPKIYDDLVDADDKNDKDKVPDWADADDDNDKDAAEAASPSDIKRELLHIMTTECYLNKALHGSHAIVRSDLEWFGPSLPHASILTVLEFMGMSKPWIRFFQSFLSAPVRFPEDLEPRVRKRGTPIGYALSVVCGEAILFMMDFAVNQRADGLHLYRMHDDLWLWDSDVKKVADAWAEMNAYAEVAGLKFNESKTGSAYVGPPLSSSGDVDGKTGPLEQLPPGDIRWGFLKFDSNQACFSIDQEDVNTHITEMRHQLAGTKSVFGWVNAYNKYMAFFLRNFGGLPANCIETQHVVDIITTLGRIQRELFPADPSYSHGGGAVGYLRKTIEERFGMKDLPDGYFYFPIVAGGLELHNPMVELLALERNFKPLIMPGGDSNSDKGRTKTKTNTSATPKVDAKEEDDDDDTDSEPGHYCDGNDYFNQERSIGQQKFTERMTYDRKAYKQLKKAWKLDADIRHANAPLAPDASDDFMSLEEYTSLRESHLLPWGHAYRHMLQTPEIHEVGAPSKIHALTEDSMERMQWHSLDTYEKWVVSMYGREFAERFGGLDAVDPTMIPTGMVKLFKSSRMKLDQ